MKKKQVKVENETLPEKTAPEKAPEVGDYLKDWIDCFVDVVNERVGGIENADRLKTVIYYYATNQVAAARFWLKKDVNLEEYETRLRAMLGILGTIDPSFKPKEEDDLNTLVQLYFNWARVDNGYYFPEMETADRDPYSAWLVNEWAKREGGIK